MNNIVVPLDVSRHFFMNLRTTTKLLNSSLSPEGLEAGTF